MKTNDDIKRLKEIVSQFFLVVVTSLLITLPFQEIFFKTDISGKYDFEVVEIKDSDFESLKIDKGIILKVNKDTEEDKRNLFLASLYLTFIAFSLLSFYIYLSVLERKDSGLEGDLK